uniref:Polymerase PB2 n=1 Tax=Beihai orthomyxo-like virus 1 TaxID=1922494 RepID=A0A1L3KKK6_9VIRU|nr:polymerase PB2 [Beihai orthomyxo-like virus 1]
MDLNVEDENNGDEETKLLAHKERIMVTVKEILKLRDMENGNETIKVLQENPVCNLRMIRKYAGVEKDPDPISTVMTTISGKYPILCDAIWAQQQPEDKRRQLFGDLWDDSRKRGMIRCKKETVDYYIETAELPTEQQMKMINVLYKQPRRIALNYHLINWDQCRVRISDMLFDRSVINTRKPIIDIPKNQRKSVITELLMPGMQIEYNSMTKTYISELNEQLGDTIVEGMRLADQARLIYNAMDTRPKVLPLIKTMTEETYENSSAIYGQNWMLENLKMGEIDNPKDTHHLRSVCSVIAYIFQSNPKEDRRMIAKSVTDMGTPLENLLRTSSFSDSYEMKVVKASLQIPFRTDSIMGHTRFYPESSNIRISKETNTVGVSWTKYSGIENVDFSTEKLSYGSVKHNADKIYQITTTWTDYKTLKNTIVDIANYCRVGWEITQGKTKKAIMNEITKTYKEYPWRIIWCDSTEWMKNILLLQDTSPKELYSKLPMIIKGTMGVLKIVAEFTPTVLSEEVHVLRDDLTMYVLDAQGRQSRFVHNQVIPPPEYFSLPDSVNSTNILVSPYLPKVSSLRKTIGYHMRRQDLWLDISKNNWCNFNSHISRLVPSSYRDSISQTCRRLLKTDIAQSYPTPYLATLYSFSGFEGHDIIIKNVFSFYIQGVGNMSLLADKGIFKYDDVSKVFTIQNEVISLKMDEPLDFNKMSKTGLSGYKIQPTSKRSVCTLEKGISKLENLPNGSQIPILTLNDTYMLIRDRTKDERLRQTVKRNIDEVDTHRASIVPFDLNEAIWSKIKRARKQ